jgi:hypothetical protein
MPPPPFVNGRDAVGSDSNRISLKGEVQAEALCDVAVVFYDQNFFFG